VPSFSPFYDLRSQLSAATSMTVVEFTTREDLLSVLACSNALQNLLDKQKPSPRRLLPLALSDFWVPYLSYVLQLYR
jgi:hypothetical protein